jgi:predicted nucleic-acid-binding Zn-ribbon protein
MKIAPCPTCGSDEVYESEPISSGGGYAPNYLPGLGKFWSAAEFTLVLCRSCGFTRFFATEDARKKVSVSGKWTLAGSR